MSGAGVDALLRLLAEQGSGEYFGEKVTITEHQLQAAHLAELDGASAPLVVAALVHDVGWLLAAASDQPSGRPEPLGRHDPPRLHETIGPHEEIGAEWLSAFLPLSVTEPVRLHVLAKRYLSAVWPAYHDGLSPASRRTLVAQGGPLDHDAVRSFEASPHAADALRLRVLDDQAKQTGARTPGLGHYEPLLRELAGIG